VNEFFFNYQTIENLLILVNKYPLICNFFLPYGKFMDIKLTPL